MPSLRNGVPAPGYSSGQAQAAVTRIANETLPKGFKFEWTDMTQQQILAGTAVPPGQVAPANSPSGVVPIFGTGTGALLNAATLTGSGTLTTIVMVDPGSQYTGTSIPTITVTNVGAATATALMSLSMTGTSSLVAGAGYTGTPPIWETSLGLVLARQGNNIFQPRAARGVATLSGSTVGTIVIEDPGFGFQKVPTAAVENAGSIASTQSTFTPVVGGVTDVSVLISRINS